MCVLHLTHNLVLGLAFRHGCFADRMFSLAGQKFVTSMSRLTSRSTLAELANFEGESWGKPRFGDVRLQAPALGPEEPHHDYE